jgi:hypothetical protein
MKTGFYAALVGALGATLILATNDASARGAGAPRGMVAHPMFRPVNAHAFHHHRGRNFFPGFDGGYYWPDSTPMGAEAYVPPATSGSNEIRYTTTYDVPWDWAHRFPPNVAPSDRPYVSSCTNEIVTVPGSRGGEQTVNVTRCY